MEHGNHESYGADVVVAVGIPVDGRGLRVSRSGLSQVACTVSGVVAAAAALLAGRPLELVAVQAYDHSSLSKIYVRYRWLNASRAAGTRLHCFELVRSGEYVFPDRLGMMYRQRTSPLLVLQAV